MPWIEAHREKKGWGKSVTPNTLKRCLVAGEPEPSIARVLLQTSAALQNEAIFGC